MNGPHDERGSASLETVIVLPAFLLFIALTVALGRVQVARQHLMSAAAETARSASLARDRTTADTRANSAAEAALANQNLHCTRTAVALDTSGFSTPVGTPAVVTATLTCHLDLGDVMLPGLPGTITLSEHAVSPLDQYRER